MTGASRGLRDLSRIVPVLVGLREEVEPGQLPFVHDSEEDLLVAVPQQDGMEREVVVRRKQGSSVFNVAGVCEEYLQVGRARP